MKAPYVHHPRPRFARAATLLAWSFAVTLLAGCGSLPDPEPTTADVTGFHANAVVLSEASTMVLVPDPDSASGEVLTQPAVPTTLAATDADAHVDFTVDVPGEYTLWARLRGEGSHADAMYVGFDDRLERVFTSEYGVYRWVEVTTEDLDPGIHTLAIRHAEPGVKLDVVAVTHRPGMTEHELERWLRGDLPSDPGDGDVPGDPGEDDPPADPGDDVPADRTAQLFEPITFDVTVPKVAGNPFDSVARVTFTHAGSDDTITTETFFDGAGEDGKLSYRFRFTGTRLGTWRYTSRSSVAALDGLSGTVEIVANDDPDAIGFFRSVNGKLAVTTAGASAPKGVAYHVFMRADGESENIARLPLQPSALRASVDALLDEAADNGFDSLFVGVLGQGFAFGVQDNRKHDSTDPDPTTFRVVETFLERAQARNMFVHIWLWGDDERGWTPRYVGAGTDEAGINGVADRRLQRYLAARLAAYPNWTMAYGFDLHEWATPSQVRSWAAYLHEHMGWFHPLTAREERRGDTLVFDLGSDQLDVASSDARPGMDGLDVYDLTRSELRAANGRPLIFERRYLYGRDGVWTMDATRRAMWRMTMAGGAGAIWGIDWDSSATAYPAPHQLVAFREFWRDRLALDGTSSRADDGSMSFRGDGGETVVTYRESTSSVRLPPVPSGSRVMALDTRSGKTSDVTPSSPRTSAWTWSAPRTSDWAVVIEPAR